MLRTVKVGEQPSSLAVDTVRDRIFAANSALNRTNGTVSVIRGSTNRVIASIPVGPRPQDIRVNPKTGRAYAANSNGNTVSVIG